MEEKKMLAEIHLKATDLGDGENVEVSVHSEGGLEYKMHLIEKFILFTEENFGVERSEQIATIIRMLSKEEANEN